MNLPAGDLTLRGPGIECPWFDSQLFSEFFDRQQHTDTHRGSLRHPHPPSALASARQRLFGGGTVPPSIGPAFLQPSRPARCHAPRPATRIRPCPGRWWGAGNPCCYPCCYRTRAFSWSLSKCTPHCRWSSCPISVQLRPMAFSPRSSSNAFAKDRGSVAPETVSVDPARTAPFSTWGVFLVCESGLRGRSQ